MVTQTCQHDHHSLPATVTHTDMTSFLSSPSPRREEVMHQEQPVGWEEQLTMLQDVSQSSDEEDDPSVSSYENLRRRNVQQNQDFLAQIGMAQAKEKVRRSLQGNTNSHMQRGLQKPPRKKSPPPPRRASLRIRRIAPTGEPLPELPPPPSYMEDMHPRCPAGPLEMCDILYGKTTSDDHTRLGAIFTSILLSGKKCQNPKAAPLKILMKDFNKLRLSETSIAKVVPDRSFSIAIHPTSDKVLLATGGKWGRVGLWDVESSDHQDGVVIYSPHSRPVCAMRFSDWYPDRLLSCSYDGTLRCGHFTKGVFDEVYATPEDEDFDCVMLRDFTFHSPDTMLVSQGDGNVAHVDLRTPTTTPEHMYRVSTRSVRSISIHPTDNNYFITAGVAGIIALWDVRKLKSEKSPKMNECLDSLRHSKQINCAVFSPVTGNRILTTCMDDRITIYNSEKFKSEIEEKTSFRHYNHVGRWLTNFRAVWHPTRDDMFVVGSMDRPRRIQIFSDSGEPLREFMSDYLGSVCSLNVIHPTLHVLAGVNSSGRIHVFK